MKANEPLPVAIAGANKRLDAKGLFAFDPRDESDRTHAVARTIGVSLEFLSEAERARFGELGVFPEDADIGVIARLWAATGGLEDFETEDLVSAPAATSHSRIVLSLCTARLRARRWQCWAKFPKASALVTRSTRPASTSCDDALRSDFHPGLLHASILARASRIAVAKAGCA